MGSPDEYVHYSPLPDKKDRVYGNLARIIETGHLWIFDVQTRFSRYRESVADQYPRNRVSLWIFWSYSAEFIGYGNHSGNKKCIAEAKTWQGK